MKTKFITAFILIFTFTFSYGFPEKDLINLYEAKDIKNLKIDSTYTPTSYELSVIYYILQNTYEKNIHQMRGEKYNVVYVKTTAVDNFYREAVFDKDNNPVTNEYNKASGNFFLNKTEPIKHFTNDMLPWLIMGNSRIDPTVYEERLYYYIYDLDYGIQTYIFEGIDENLKIIDFNSLENSEKMAYRFFAHILFNKNYKIKLNTENKIKLKEDGDFYRSYFLQIQEILNFE